MFGNTLVSQLFMKAGWVSWPLGLCSILAVAIILERIFTLSRLQAAEERAFEQWLTASPGGLAADPMLDATVTAAPISQIVGVLRTLQGAGGEALLQAATVAIAVQRLRLRRYLTLLATIGSTAPFIGLFGTVLGVMRAFDSLANAGAERMATGIAEALSATALGLMVAIPSVVAYNLILGRVQANLLRIESHVARILPLLNVTERERERV